MLDPQEERAKFISLREALFLIAQKKDKTPQEAAQMLLLNLSRADNWQELEPMRYSLTQGMLRSIYITEELHHMLFRLTAYNDHTPEPDDDIVF